MKDPRASVKCGGRRARRVAAPLSLEPWQWSVLALSWVALFLLPAMWMWRRAARDGDSPFVWSMLVLVGSFLGVLEYYHHRSILRRRARRAERAAAAQTEAAEARRATSDDAPQRDGPSR